MGAKRVMRAVNVMSRVACDSVRSTDSDSCGISSRQGRTCSGNNTVTIPPESVAAVEFVTLRNSVSRRSPGLRQCATDTAYMSLIPLTSSKMLVRSGRCIGPTTADTIALQSARHKVSSSLENAGVSIISLTVGKNDVGGACNGGWLDLKE